MVKAYVLMQLKVGSCTQVRAALRHIPEVTGAEDVTGPYDMVAIMQGESLDLIGRTIVDHLQQIPGITRTVTCPVVNL